MSSSKTCVCAKCSSPIRSNAYKIQCKNCQSWYHRDCANLTIEQIQDYTRDKENNDKIWICINCKLSNSSLTEMTISEETKKLKSDKKEMDRDMLILENFHLKRIIKELEDKNTLLIQNKELLEKRVSDLETKTLIQNNYPLTSKQTTTIQKCINSQDAKANESQMAQPDDQECNIPNKIRQISSYSDMVNRQPTINKDETKNPRRQFNRTVKTGTAETEDLDFAGRCEKSDKKVWLFISRVKNHVSEDKIRNYIKEKTKSGENELEDSEVIVKHIPTAYDNSRKDCKCFQVGVKFEKKDMLYQSNFWPKGVAFRRFKFNFKESNTNNNFNTNEDF